MIQGTSRMKKKSAFGHFLSLAQVCSIVVSASLVTLSLAQAQDETAALGVQRPAIKSSKVVQSLLQDIVRVGDRLVVVGERGHIATSDDSGKTWQQAEVPTRAMINAVYFISPNEGWAVGYDELVLHTTDGGKNWEIQLDGLKFTRKRMADNIPVLEAKLAALEADKKAADDQLEGVQSPDAGAVATDDVDVGDDIDAADGAHEQIEARVAELEDKISVLEADLEDAKKALVNTVANPLMSVWFRDEKTGFAVGAFGEIIMTADGGVSWTNIAERLDNPDRNHLNAITGQGDLMYIAGEAGRVYRSTNGGTSWTLLRSNMDDGSFFSVDIVSANEVFIAGLRGVMFRSSDQGNSWKQINDSLQKNINAVYFDGKDSALAAGNDGAFLRSRDGGRTFQPHPRKNRLTVASVTVAADGNYILVGAGGVEIVPPASL